MSRRHEKGACPLFPRIRQAAKYTGASEKWIREQVHAGILPTYQLEPGSWPRIELAALIALIRTTRRDNRSLDAAPCSLELRQ